MPGRFLLTGVLLLLSSLVGAQESVFSQHWTDQYDSYFKKYSKRYFGPFFEWNWFKAQAIAESGLRPAARSEVGAVGLMQIMPNTFKEIRELNTHFVDIETPRWNIAAGIYYDRQLFRKWRSPSDHEKIFYTLASYNAGYGRVLRAFNKAKSQGTEWQRVAPYVPGQTRRYVRRIRSLMGEGRQRGKQQRARGRGRFDYLAMAQLRGQ